MAKRYHDAKRNMSNHVDDEFARRTREMEEGGMIHNDMRAIANMPQEVMIKPYEKAGRYLPEDLDDTIRGVDHQMSDLDGGKVSKGFNPKKV